MRVRRRSIALEEVDRDLQQALDLRHIARNAPPEGLNRLAALGQKQFPGNLDFQAELLLAINEGIVQRGLTPEQGVLAWAEKLAGELLAATEAVGTHWVAEPAKGVPPSGIPWIVQTRSIPASTPKWKNHPHPDHPTASPWIPQVRASNDAARRLYGRLGFYVAGTRRNYYTSPVEDALILWRDEEIAR